jgi:methyl-accepting chemotaxis protein
MPDGAYWSLTQGRISALLTDRPYFPRLLAGQTVIGDLVVSRSTNRNTAIVAVPIFGQEHEVVGLLGASVHLDSLAAVLRQEMGGLGDGLLFFAIDEKGLGALNSEPSLIFTEPLKLGDSGMRQAFEKILADQQGVVTYDFRGVQRTVLYQRSPITNWSYGFGLLHR